MDRRRILAYCSIVLIITLGITLVTFLLSPAAYSDSWTRLATQGIEGHFDMSRQPYAMAVFNGKLYVGTSASIPRGGFLFCYDGSSWKAVSTEGFGDQGNTRISSLVVYGSYLYAATENYITGCEVWRTAGVGGPPYTDWTKVNNDGFGSSANRSGSSMVEFNSNLYVLASNSSTGCQLWRTAAAGGPPFADWTKVNSNGFGNGNNLGASLAVYSSHLFAGTYNTNNGCQVWWSAGAGGPPYTDWQQVNINGFGRPDLNVRTMIVYGGYLFAGVYNSTSGCEVIRTAASGGPPFTDWTLVNSNGFGDSRNFGLYSMAVFNSSLYVGTYAYETGCEIWRTSTVGGPPYTDWQQVNSNGFGNTANEYAWSMAVFGTSLFVGTFNGTTGTEVWRSDGVGGPAFTDWAMSNTAGFVLNDNVSVASMAWFNGDLYVGTQAGTTAGLCQVWQYHDASWTQVNSSGFGSAGTYGAVSMHVMGSYLYVGTLNDSGGCRVWRTAGVGGPPFTDWTQVNANGFADANNQGASSMEVLGSHLYVGTSRSGPNCQVWRTAGVGGPPYTDWVQVNANGFGDANNVEATSMAAYGSRLYVGTKNTYTGCELWCTSGGSGPPYTDWAQVNSNGFGSAASYVAPDMAVFNSGLYVGAQSYSTPGARVWRTAAAGGPPYTDWAQVNNNGFGDSSNYGALSLAVVGASLYVGTYRNANGCQVWETNGVGGLPFTDWTKTNTDGFGDTYNYRATRLMAVGTALFAGTYNAETGCDVWMTSIAPAPTLTTVNPDDGDRGTASLPVVMSGTGFQGGATVQLTGSGVPDINMSVDTVTDTTISGTLDLTTAEAGARDVTVTNPDYQSVTLQDGFTVDNPAPATTSISPTSKNVGDAGFTLTVNGTNFLPGSLVRLDGADRATTYVSGTRLTAPIYASDLGEARDFQVTVFNPAPGGGTSNARTFTVEYPSPDVTGITPSSGTAGTNVSITNLAGTGFRTGATVKLEKSGSSDITATNVAVVSPTKITCTFTLPAGTTLVAWNLYVENPDGKNDTKTNAFTVNAPVSPRSTWYLAEGTTAWGFETYISIMNPNSSAVDAKVTFMPTGQATVTETVNLPARSQTTLTNDHLLQKMGAALDFSTKVEATDNTRPIAVDRTMSWTGPGAASPEGHSSVGVNAPGTTWYLPEGSTNWGFETWLLIQNPNGGKATCQVTYMIEGSDPVTKTKEVPANSRQSYSMQADIGNKDASIKVVSDIPVIPERAMYRNNRREGHDSIGTTSPATDYYLAEGTSAWGFTTYVLVQNPNNEKTDVTVTYMTADGPKPQAPFPMEANSRKTIRVNDALPNTDFSTQVHGSKPIIAERAMYWDAGKGEACHDSIGMSAPAMTFYLPDGETSNGRETYTLVQNPNGSAVQVTISYLLAGGGTPVTFTETIPANSRKTYNMADKGVSGRAAVLVESAAGGRPIMVERAMYWNSRGAGTDTIGGSAE